MEVSSCWRLLIWLLLYFEPVVSPLKFTVYDSCTQYSSRFSGMCIRIVCVHYLVYVHRTLPMPFLRCLFSKSVILSRTVSSLDYHRFLLNLKQTIKVMVIICIPSKALLCVCDVCVCDTVCSVCMCVSMCVLNVSVFTQITVSHMY